MSDRAALSLLGTYTLGLLLTTGHFWKGICAQTWASGPELQGQYACTAMSSFFWPIVLPIEFSFWLF